MKILIGVTPDDSGSDAMALGALLSRALRAEPVLCNVRPADYDYVSRGHVDAEWTAYLNEQAQQTLADAAEEFAEQWGFADVATDLGAHHSSGHGLAERAAELAADMIVIGSAPYGAPGRFQIGSTADQLLHGSAIPVATAPSGYRHDHGRAIEEFVVAFQNAEDSGAALRRSTEFAARADAAMTIMTILVRHRVRGSKVGTAGEGAIMEQLAEQIAAEQTAALADVDSPSQLAALTLIDDSPRRALASHRWRGNEVLVLGSARGGRLRRVFLGDMTYKLLRATPVPAIVLPHTPTD